MTFLNKLINWVKNPRTAWSTNSIYSAKTHTAQTNTTQNNATQINKQETNHNLETQLKIGYAVYKKARLESLNKYRPLVGLKTLNDFSRNYSNAQLNDYEDELSSKINIIANVQKQRDSTVKVLRPLPKPACIQIKDAKKTPPTERNLAVLLDEAWDLELEETTKIVAPTPTPTTTNPDLTIQTPTTLQRTTTPTPVPTTTPTTTPAPPSQSEKYKKCETQKIVTLQNENDTHLIQKMYNGHMRLAKTALKQTTHTGPNLPLKNSAEYHFREANTLVPGTIAGLNLAEILLNKNKYSDAIKVLEEQEQYQFQNRTGAYIYELKAKAHFWQGDFDETILNMGKSFKISYESTKINPREKDIRKTLLDTATFLNAGTRNLTTDKYATQLIKTAKETKNKKLQSKIYEYASKLSSDMNTALQYARSAVSFAYEEDENYLSALQTLAETYHLCGKKGEAGITLKGALRFMDTNPHLKTQFENRYEELKNLEEFYLKPGIEMFQKLEEELQLKNKAIQIIKNGEKNHALANKLYKFGKRKSGNSTKLYQYAALLTDKKHCAIACAKLAVKESKEHIGLNEKLTSLMTLAELYTSNIDTNQENMREYISQSRENYQKAKKITGKLQNYLNSHPKVKQKYARIYNRANTINSLTSKILEVLV